MAASIALPWVPRIKRPEDTTSELACSVTKSPSEYSLNSQAGGAGPAPFEGMHTTGKKVDFVVVVDMDDSPLKRTIKKLTDDAAMRAMPTRGLMPLPHVNQTPYLVLQDSPIAVSIETKLEANESTSLLQLGIWVAAWHRRMYALSAAQKLNMLDARFRREQAGQAPVPGAADEASTDPDLDIAPTADGPSQRSPLLVSQPLIVVTNHQWVLYFACDRGDSIGLHGPLTLGSTSNLLEIYTLVASLEAIREWVETTFHDALKAWFLCGD